ncbi:lipoprotein-releasing ABC transporter permease subunit LolE [Candidatus Profftia tarda]|uniref:Lipoprotein-releasing system transmembrane protein LolE n=1 Tax=Candidatus Profftia tarda TaxID=1177216 RepID=A0A8E4F0E0_9ENTR|nr:lipoprotein-releasing ABC transporter permease subunit LolE [Candidatus Profftia tarda]CAD6512201.1 Lipoprotein-releasing system transmembrane protein LolE [Candidatus Profftia tarda]
MSISSLSLLIGLRFSRGRCRGSILSLIAMISTISIALGVAVFIVGLSAMNGFERELDSRIISVVPHGEIYPAEQPFNDWQEVLNCITKVNGIAAVSPYVSFTGLIERGTKLVSVQFRGVNPKKEPYVTSLSQYVIGDSWSTFRGGEHQVILGKGVADMLNVQKGDWVTVILSNNSKQMKLLKPQEIRLHVSGILELSGMLDHSLAIVPLTDGQKYNHLGDSVTGISVKVNDVFKADKILFDAAKVINNDVYINTWKKSYGYIFRDIQMIRAIIYLAMLLVIGLSCFNIASTLVIAVKDKSSNIAVLITLGAKDRLIRSIFIWYGLLSGIVGSLFGMIIGIIASFQLTNIYKFIEKITGYRLLSGNIYPINFLPTELQYLDVVKVFIMAITLSAASSWYPAGSASRINPARIL